MIRAGLTQNRREGESEERKEIGGHKAHNREIKAILKNRKTMWRRERKSRKSRKSGTRGKKHAKMIRDGQEKDLFSMCC